MPTVQTELPSREDVLFELQVQTEDWFKTASTEQILERLGFLHGRVNEGISDLACGKWDEPDSNFGVAHKCPSCDYFILAWETIAHTSRPELKYLR